MSRWCSVVTVAIAALGFAPPTAGAVPVCGALKATIVGTGGADGLRGTRDVDVIVGRGGADRIRGLAGGDIVCAGKGDDRVAGGAGLDVLHGGRGDDRLSGGQAPDLLVGDEGDDQLRGEAAGDGHDGGPGADGCRGGGDPRDRVMRCERGDRPRGKGLLLSVQVDVGRKGCFVSPRSLPIKLRDTVRFRNTSNSATVHLIEVAPDADPYDGTDTDNDADEPPPTSSDPEPEPEPEPPSETPEEPGLGPGDLIDMIVDAYWEARIFFEAPFGEVEGAMEGVIAYECEDGTRRGDGDRYPGGRLTFPR